jgi:hypothetical protein
MVIFMTPTEDLKEKTKYQSLLKTRGHPIGPPLFLDMHGAKPIAPAVSCRR